MWENRRIPTWALWQEQLELIRIEDEQGKEPHRKLNDSMSHRLILSVSAICIDKKKTIFRSFLIREMVPLMIIYFHRGSLPLKRLNA